MSDVIQVTILNRLKTVVASDFSAGFSGVDLRDRVTIGVTVGANYVPSANISFVDTIQTQGKTLGRYIGESVYQIVCYTGGSSVEERLTKALNLGGDVQKSITSDRSLGLSGLTEDVIVNLTAVDGEEYGISQIGITLLEVRITHQSETGT